jgi:hypothetical protein
MVECLLINKPVPKHILSKQPLKEMDFDEAERRDVRFINVAQDKVRSGPVRSPAAAKRVKKFRRP